MLAEVDEAVGQLSGPATKRILWRMCHVFGDKRFERLAGISNGHIYNLRARRAYRGARTTFRGRSGSGAGQPRRNTEVTAPKEAPRTRRARPSGSR